MALISAKELSVGYDGEAVASNINFEINKGDYFCIIGENGAGKSTLMKTLLKLLKPVSGEITYDKILHDQSIGYLPQQTEVQRDFPASVREIVLSGNVGRRGAHAFYTKEDKARADVNMERMGILELRDKCYRKLSGGQQQRVLLARALCAADDLLLLDEPVSGLDPIATSDMYETIAKLNKEGITIIMVSHDLEGAQRYVSHFLKVTRKGSEVFVRDSEMSAERERSELWKIRDHAGAVI